MDKQGRKAVIIVLVIIAVVIALFIVLRVWNPLGKVTSGDNYFGLGPGGCNNEKECTDYCIQHPGECVTWCEEHQAICPQSLKDNLDGLRALEKAQLGTQN